MDLFLPPQPKDTDALTHLSTVLKESGQWLTAKQLLGLTGLGDRQLRDLAESSEGAIISGQQGYKHADCATAEEIQHASGWLISQGRKMVKRGLRILRRAHTALQRTNSLRVLLLLLALLCLLLPSCSSVLQYCPIVVAEKPAGGLRVVPVWVY